MPGSGLQVLTGSRENFIEQEHWGLGARMHSHFGNGGEFLCGFNSLHDQLSPIPTAKPTIAAPKACRQGLSRSLQ